jgi:hypothetical protein
MAWPDAMPLRQVSSPAPLDAQGEIVLGNWDDGSLLEGEKYQVAPATMRALPRVFDDALVAA